MTTNGLLNRVTDNNCWLNAAYQGLVTLVDYRILLQGYVQQGRCDAVVSNIENIVNFLATGARVEKSNRDFNTMLYQLAKNLRFNLYHETVNTFQDADDFFLKLLECEFYLPIEFLLDSMALNAVKSREIPDNLLKYEKTLNSLLRYVRIVQVY